MPHDLTLARTNTENPDFLHLVEQLDADLEARNGDFQIFHGQFNKLLNIKHTILAYDDGEPVGCGAIKEYSASTVEVKRMFVSPGKQGRGIATIILKELETWARELGYSSCILQTGINQPEAIRLYEKNNYAIIENFGQYKGDKNSVCFEKVF